MPTSRVLLTVFPPRKRMTQKAAILKPADINDKITVQGERLFSDDGIDSLLMISTIRQYSARCHLLMVESSDVHRTELMYLHSRQLPALQASDSIEGCV